MKIALIHPYNPFLMNDKVFPSMGIVRVGTKLQQDGHEVQILDFAGKDYREITKEAFNFDYYGFTSTTPQFPYVMEIFNELKRVNPNAKTILGGPHASALHKLRCNGITDININDLNAFDTIFAGEGEDSRKILLPKWQKGDLISHIDDVPIPNRDLIDIKSYKYNLNGQDTTNIQTQRGCPHQCSFCSGRDIEMYNHVRTHSPERVIQEMDQLHEKYGYNAFMWYDDEINLNMNRLEHLCELLSERPYIHRGFVRSDNIVKHPESVEWMKKAGFVKLCTGVESGSDRILKNINKRTTRRNNSLARKIIGEVGIHYEAFLLLGHPDETIEDIAQTLDWLRKNKPDDFDINLITPYPGSKIYDESTPSTKWKEYKWEYKGLYFNKPRYSKEDSYYKGKNGDSESTVRTTQIPNIELRKLRKVIEREKLKCRK